MLPEELKRIRAKKGITKIQVAKLIGVSQRTITRFEAQELSGAFYNLIKLALDATKIGQKNEPR